MQTNKFDPMTYVPWSKTSIGFDEVFKRLTDLGETFGKVPVFPPYNIRKIDESKYVIEMAIAGFSKNDIELTFEGGVLTIKGTITSDEPNEYIFKGIADRNFVRKFSLSDTVEVKNADLINGMLKIWLERFLPDYQKAKKIPINEATPEPLSSPKKEKIKEVA